MNGWPDIELGEIMPERAGTVDPAKFPDEVFDLYSIPAFDGGTPEIVAGKQIGSAKQIVQPGDVLLSKIVPHIRRAWIVGEDQGRRLIASSEWIVFRNARFWPPFLRQILVSDPFHAKFMSTVSGVGGSLLRARPAHVAKIKIPEPPETEQKRITAILDQAEALRAKRRQALARLDTLTQSLFVDLFGQPAKNEKVWSIKPLGDYLTFLTSGGRGWAEFYTTRGSRFIRSLDVQMNYIGNDDIAYVNPPDNAEARRTRVAAGDVLLTITGSKVGRVAPVGQELAGSYVSQHVSILRLKTDDLHPMFVSFFLSLESGGQRQIAKAQYGQTKPGLNFDQIRRFELPIPPLNVQREFVRRFAVVEKLREAQSASASKLEALFASLQHRAFRGEL